MHWRRKWQPTPVFLPGESQGLGSLVGRSLWGHMESDMTTTKQQIRYPASHSQVHFMSCSIVCYHAPHSSTLAGKISWTEEPGGLQSMGSLRVGHDSKLTFTFQFPALEKEMATHSSILAWRIPGTGEPGGLPSTGSHRVGHD